MSRKQNRAPEDAKCCVCKLKAYSGFYRVFEKDGEIFPVCSKMCGVHGKFIEKPVRKYQVTRNEGYAPSSEGLAGAI